MKNQKDPQQAQLVLDAIRVVLNAKFTASRQRGPALGFNGEESPPRALRLARQHLHEHGLSDEDVVWDGCLLSSLLKNGINKIDVIAPYPTQHSIAEEYINHHGQATAKVPTPDIKIVITKRYCVPGQLAEGRVQVPFNCDTAY